MPRCQTDNWYEFVTTRICAVWLSAISSLPGLCAPSLLLSLYHCSFSITSLCHIWIGAPPAFGQGGHLRAWRYLRAGCTSWGAEGRHMSGSALLWKLPCESLPSFRHTWLRGSTCARGTVTCVYPGSSSIPCVAPCSFSCISVSSAFSCIGIILLALKTFGT